MKSFIALLLKLFFKVKQIKITELPKLTNILIIRQHNQFGDLLVSNSLFLAIKEKYPKSKITVIVSPQNKIALTKNPNVDLVFNFDKKKLFNICYFKSLVSVLRNKYDLCIVPATVSLSTTSSVLCRLSDSKIKLGVGSLDGKINKFVFLYNISVDLDTGQNPNQHIADFIQEIIKPVGISTKNLLPAIAFDKEDLSSAEKFIADNFSTENDFLIGLHPGAGKPPNRWPEKNFIELINKLNDKYKSSFYLTGTTADNLQLEAILSNSKVKLGLFKDKSISELAALISLSNLFITNDTGVMHVAGSTKTPQISLFGPTNPNNWAPLGEEKYYCKNSELINDIGVEEVFNLCIKILDKKNNEK